MSELRYLTLGSLFSETASRFPSNPAIEYMGTVLTYSEFEEESDRLARGLLSLGIIKGTHVGIWANDRANTLLLFCAVVKIGAIAVMLGTSLAAAEVAALIEQSEVRYLVFDEGFRDTIFPDVCRRNLTHFGPHRLIYIGEMEIPESDFTSYSDLLSYAGNIPKTVLERVKSSVLPEDTDTILFTSGTLGIAKGVLTTHYSRVNSALAHAKSLEVSEKDKFCIALPIFHCFSLTGGVLTALSRGACAYFPPNRRTKSILEAIAHDKCTILHAVPTLYSAILARPDIKDFDLSSLRTGFIGGSSYTAEFFTRVEETLGFTLMPSLGQTEATAGFTFLTMTESLHRRSTTVGRFMDCIEGSIRDMVSGEEVGEGETGEISIRGFNVMQGYYARPEYTKEVLSGDGWLKTGDLGYLDSEGYIHMTGRLKELIIRGGENITPSEIEEILMSSGKIKEVKAIGVPDSHYGEEICLFVVPGLEVEITEDEIREELRSKLAYFKIPKYVLFTDSIPKTSSGKVALGQLKEYAQAYLEK